MARELELRPYQIESIEGLRAGIKAGHRAQILCAPTGAGKTVCAVHLLREAQRKGSRCMFIVDRTNLVDQTSAVLDAYGIDHGVVQANHWRHRNYEPIQVCSAQTIEKRGFFPDAKLLMVDECFPGDVEILTDHGFVRFESLPDDALVAQYSQKSDSITFVKPTEKIKRPYHGDLVHISSNRLVDVMMTPWHELLVRDINHAGMAYRKIPAEVATLNVNKRMRVAAMAVGDNKPLSPMERMLIAAQADGSLHTKQRDGTATFSFSFSKQRKIDRFISIVTQSGLPWTEVSGKSSNRDEVKARRRFMVRRMPVDSKDIHKHFSIDIGASRAAEIIEEMVHWDGHIGKGNNNYYYSSTDRYATDFFQAVALLAGYKTNCTIQRDDRSNAYNDVYRLFIQKSFNEISGQRIKRSVVPYIGDVHCVRVPEGNIVIRSNGKPLIIGNCHVVRAQTAEFITNRKDIVVVGLTATPLTKGLGKIYTNVVNVTTTNKLIDEGFLIRPTIYAAKRLDMTGAKVVAGEWAEKDIEDRGLKIIGDVVQGWIDKTQLHFGGPVKTIVFSATVAHGAELCKQFNEAGYNFRQISYKDGSDETRREIIAEYRKPNSDIIGLVSCEVFTRGFDVPDVLCGISARPYRKSLSSHIQQLGRILRPAPGKTEALWLCCSGNAIRFREDVEEIFANGVSSLDDGAREERHKEPQEKEIKEHFCECGYLLSAEMETCPACGKQRSRRAMVENVPGELVAIDGKARKKKSHPILDNRERVMRQLSGWAMERKNGNEDSAKRWAAGQYKSLYGVWPRGVKFDPSAPNWVDAELRNLVTSNIIRWAKSKQRAA